MTADVPETLVERADELMYPLIVRGMAEELREVFAALHSEGLIYWAEELEQCGHIEHDTDDNLQVIVWNASSVREEGLYRLRRDTP